MSDKSLDPNKLSKVELLELYNKVLIEKNDLELERIVADKQILKSKQRTIDVFGKMIDVKKAQRIIAWQNEELEKKNLEIIRQKNILETNSKKFRQRSIELFGKMIDIKKANKIIQQQKEEIENQRKLLHETNLSKDKFFSILAHDLKNPIGGFLGLTELMATKNEQLSPENNQIFIESLHESSKQLYSLLENLLNWARAQTGSLHLNPTATDIGYLLDLAINQVSMNAHLKSIGIRKQNGISTKVIADADTVNTILRNLLSNAIKFSNPESYIDITVSENENHALISITDFGVGIAEDEINNLFRIDKTHSKPGTAKETGTGLGLILCKEFIELNGGKINVESVENSCTTFSISLPLAAEINIQ